MSPSTSTTRCGLFLLGVGLTSAVSIGVDGDGLHAVPSTASASTIASTGEAARCDQLKGRHLGNAIVEEADRIEKGSTVSTTFMGPVAAPVGLCRARATASPVPGSTIKIEVWLPDNWNGKMVGTGGGGLNGGLGNSDKDHAMSVGRGYAGVINDLGHSSSAPTRDWAYKQPQRIVDFGDRGDHVSALVGKAVVAEYFGKGPVRSYFQGCSGGGREALMLAQRHPTDYDAIIAGAPAADFSGLMAAGLWNTQLFHRTPGAAGLPAKLTFLHNAAVAKCDTLDGVTDGVISNPLACRFDPSEIQCKAGENSSRCLTPDEVAAVREIYRGLLSAAGRSLAPGLTVGSEAGWGPFITEKGIGALLLSGPFFQWIVAQDPNFSAQAVDGERGYKLAKARVGSVVDAINPDLRAFTRRGGKLIIYHGWEDPVIPAVATANYYAAVRKTMGPAVNSSVRLFLMPGVSHCEGGTGPSVFDKLALLERWKEHGLAPDRVIVSKFENDQAAKEGRETKLLRTRPICPWPKAPRYKGQGSTDDAANFVCSATSS